MTLDEFRAKYRLQNRLTQRGVASYQALDSSGRVVMVHSLDSASRGEVDHVRSLTHRLDAVDRKKILEILDVDGAPVLVTEYLQGFQTLTQWLEIRTRSTPTEPRAPAVEPNRPPRGEFTQLFGPAEVPKTPVLERPATASSPTASAPPAPPAAGDFTRMFGSVQQTVSGPPERPAVAKESPAPETPGAGEFTGLFGALSDRGAPAPPSLPPATPATAKGPTPPGDFTQLFGPGAGAPPAAPSEPPPVPDEQPKVVVRWRDRPPAESPPPPSAAKPQIRWKPSGPSEDIGRPGRPAASPPPPSPPGEFTRLFGPQDSVAAAPESAAADIRPPLAEPPAPEPPLHRPPAHAPRAGGAGGGGTNAPGGFTQLLRAAADSPGDPTNPPEAGGPPPLSGPPPVSASPTSAPPGEFTSLMAGLPSAPAAPGAAPRAPAQPAGFGPSEFTRIVAGMAAPPAAGGGRPKAAAPPPEPAAEDEGGRPSLVWLFVALGVVFVLAAALVVFFALKK